MLNFPVKNLDIISNKNNKKYRNTKQCEYVHIEYIKTKLGAK